MKLCTNTHTHTHKRKTLFGGMMKNTDMELQFQKLCVVV